MTSVDSSNQSFKQEYTLEERMVKSARIRTRYPGKIAVICESSSRVERYCRTKYIVPPDLTIGQFVYILRQIVPPSNRVLFVYISHILLPTSVTMNAIYSRFADRDGFLYLEFSDETYFE